MKSNKIFIVVVTLLVVLAIPAGVYYALHLRFAGRILPGVNIAGVDVGGLTKQEAMEKIGARGADAVTDKPFALVLDGPNEQIRYEFKPSQAGARFLPSETLDDALQASQNENYLKLLYFKVKKIDRIINPKMEIADKGMLKRLVGQVAKLVNCDPVSAAFVVVPAGRKSGKRYKISVKDEQAGLDVKIDETAMLLDQSIQRGVFESDLIVDSTQPKVTSTMLRKIPDPSVIGSYSTYYGSHDSPNRISNIYLVASFVDDTYLASGEEFSLLPIVGAFTKDRGFKEAYVIVGNELVPQYGGGTCQIATTLYNAVMKADLDILRRVNHGIYFSIYPLGRDATVYPPYDDLRFRNNTGQPIVISALPSKKGLTFRIIGTPTGKTVTFSAPQIFNRYQKVMTREAGSDKQVKKTVKLPAFSTKVIRTVKKNGVVIKKEVIHSSYKLSGDKQKIKIKRKEPR